AYAGAIPDEKDLLDEILHIADMDMESEETEDFLYIDGQISEAKCEEVAEDLLPFGQTDSLIQEAVNLKTEYRNDKIKLVEPRNGTKDRIVILSYVNYIMTLIENEWLKQQQNDDSSWDDFNLVY
ncbi:MAG: hypothetical protein U0K83_00225, partial [Bacteroidales bacterium]|nr:hypothetical protein [Bacteroidales bacterium]